MKINSFILLQVYLYQIIKKNIKREEKDAKGEEKESMLKKKNQNKIKNNKRIYT